MWDREVLAWLGGLFEGEGTISVPSKKAPIRLRIHMTDRDVLDRFRHGAKCGLVHGPFKPSGLGKKPVFAYTISGKKAYALAAALWGYLGARRREQVSRAFCAYAGLSPYRSLEPHQVAEIKDALSRGKHGVGRTLASRYGVSDGMISAIKHGRAWRSVCAST